MLDSAGGKNGGEEERVAREKSISFFFPPFSLSVHNMGSIILK